MILLAALVLLILWTLTVATAIRLVFPLRAIGQRSPVSFLASLFAASALTFNFPPVYVAVDTLLGGRNLASLVQHTCLVLTAFFVTQLMMRSAGKLSRTVNMALAGSLALTLGVQTTAFLLITPLPTTVDLMLASHTQVAALVFSLSHFLYFGVASAIAVYVGVLLWRTPHGSASQVSAGALLIGGGAGVANVAVVAVRDTSRLTGNMAVEVLDPLYRVLIFVIAFGFCIGLAVPALTGAVRRRRIAHTLTVLERALERSDAGWTPVTTVDDLDEPASPEDAFATLNSAVIRLRDGQMFENGPELTDTELDALTNAEMLLRGGR